MKHKLSLWLQATFYFLGGLNHFINPQFYLELIPRYLVYFNELNLLAGIAEVILGLGLIYRPTRKMAVYGIILMLIAFIPSHVYFIQIGSCLEGGLCAPAWVGWLRLLLVHPALMFWAWTVRKY